MRCSIAAIAKESRHFSEKTARNNRVPFADQRCDEIAAGSLLKSERPKSTGRAAVNVVGSRASIADFAA